MWALDEPMPCVMRFFVMLIQKTGTCAGLFASATQKFMHPCLLRTDRTARSEAEQGDKIHQSIRGARAPKASIQQSCGSPATGQCSRRTEKS
jgi:hypothetical protein